MSGVAGGRISPPPPPRSLKCGRQGLPSAIPSSQKVEGGFVEGAKKGWNWLQMQAVECFKNSGSALQSLKLYDFKS